MARTQAVYYRDRHGAEPVDAFIEALSPKGAATIDDYVEEHLNGQPPDAPPPQFPITSQIEGGLRELRVRFANTRYRILYQRCGNWSCSCTRSRSTRAQCRSPTSSWPGGAWLTSNDA